MRREKAETLHLRSICASRSKILLFLKKKCHRVVARSPSFVERHRHLFEPLRVQNRDQAMLAQRSLSRAHKAGPALFARVMSTQSEPKKLWGGRFTVSGWNSGRGQRAKRVNQCRHTVRSPLETDTTLAQGATDPLMERFNESINFDKRLCFV